MYIINGIAYAGENDSDVEVKDFSILDDMMMLITFSTGEKRLLDANILMEYPAFKPLENEEIFRTAKIEHGVLTWLDGNIDIASEALYDKCLSYQECL